MSPASGEKSASLTGLESFSDHISKGLSDSDLDHRTRLQPLTSSSSDEPHERAVGRARTSQSLNMCTCDHFPPLLASRACCHPAEKPRTLSTSTSLPNGL